MHSFTRNSGISLLIFSGLLLFTMVLHPAGGNIEYLIKISSVIVITHAVAILSLPFGLAGFWGLTRQLGTDNFPAVLAFSAIVFGLVAVLIAAATNGIVLPVFLRGYAGATQETTGSLQPILRYGFSINEAFDYIYTGAFCLAIASWCAAMLHTMKFPKWIGWAGIAIAVSSAVIFGSGLAHTLPGFRMFVSLIIAWIAVVGVYMIRIKSR
jgi:hypothetical protein